MGLMMLIATRWLPEGWADFGMVLASRLGLCLLGGLLVGIAPLFMHKALACSIKGNRLAYEYFALLGVSAFLIYLAFFYFLHWRSALTVVLAYAFFTTVGVTASNFYSALMVFKRWRSDSGIRGN